MSIIEYETHNWKDAELITAAKLNEMDRAIAAINDATSNSSELYINKELTFINENGWHQTPVLFAQGQENVNTGGGIIYDQTTGKWMFRHITNSNTYEDFYLPPSVGIGDGEKYYYNILTDKNTGALTYSGMSWESNEKSVPSGTWTQLNSITISAGKYIIFGVITFKTNTSGRRAVTIHTSTQDPSTSAAISIFARATFVPSDAYTTFPLCSYYTATDETEIRISGWQSSGSAIGTIGGLAALRIT